MPLASPRRSKIRAHARQTNHGFRPLRAELLESRALLAGLEVNFPIINFNGLAYFPGRTDDGDFHLWRSDGTLTGTRLVSDVSVFVANDDPSFMAVVNGTLFFSGYDEFNLPRLWKSDGTAAGTTQVTSSENPAQYLSDLTAVGNTLFFDAWDGVHRYLWKSDGTDAGTVLVKAVTVGASEPYLTNVNGTLFFKGNDAAGGDELWKSDGTEAGTVRVKDIRPGPTGSGASQLTNVNGTLFFTANDGTSGEELWRSDGTETGTIMLNNIAPAATSSSPRSLFAFGSNLLFNATDGTSGAELWTSDGTPEGTQLLSNIRSGPFGSFPQEFVNKNGTVFFVANSTGGMNELWRTTGTSAGTELVKTPLGDSTVGVGPSSLTDVNGTIFFVIHGNATGEQLWKSNGTISGTVVVKTFTPSTPYTLPEQLVSAGGRLFFTRKDDAARPVLWTSNGTDNGTLMIDLSGNHPPIAVDDQINIAEDQSIIADPPGVLVNDSDPDHDSLTAVLDVQPLHGTLQLGPAGNFTYKPNDNFNGTDQFVYHATDGKVTSGLATVTIHMAAVNDPPSFTAGPDQMVTDDAGEQIIPFWAQDISPGPSDESSQKLTFQATADHPSLFAVAPKIDATTGRLTFTPALNAQGDAVITVKLQDDGGTASGGSNTSAEQTFTITVYKVHPWRNSLDRLDVNGDTRVAGSDALDIINYLNASGSGPLPEDAITKNRYYDTDGDGKCTSNDALEVINDINSRPPQSGEFASQFSGESQSLLIQPDLLTLLASDTATTSQRRRR